MIKFSACILKIRERIFKIHLHERSSRHFSSHTLNILTFRHNAIALAKVTVLLRDRRHVSNERANVHKNVRGVFETLNHRLLFRRGIDEPTESFSINHRRVEKNKKHEESREQ